MGFSSSKSFDPGDGHDADTELRNALCESMQRLEKRKRGSFGRAPPSEAQQRDDVRVLHEAYQYMQKRFVHTEKREEDEEAYLVRSVDSSAANPWAALRKEAEEEEAKRRKEKEKEERKREKEEEEKKVEEKEEDAEEDDKDKIEEGEEGQKEKEDETKEEEEKRKAVAEEDGEKEEEEKEEEEEEDDDDDDDIPSYVDSSEPDSDLDPELDGNGADVGSD